MLLLYHSSFQAHRSRVQLSVQASKWKYKQVYGTCRWALVFFLGHARDFVRNLLSNKERSTVGVQDIQKWRRNPFVGCGIGSMACLWQLYGIRGLT